MKTLFLLLLCAFAWTTGNSQHTSASREYWVVETHSRDSVYSIVRFFGQSDQLLHEVKIDDVVIDIRQKKQRKRLDRLLTVNHLENLRLRDFGIGQRRRESVRAYSRTDNKASRF